MARDRTASAGGSAGLAMCDARESSNDGDQPKHLPNHPEHREHSREGQNHVEHEHEHERGGGVRPGGEEMRVRLGAAWPPGRYTLTAVAFGVFMGALAGSSSQAVASVLAGVGGVAISLLVMGGLALRRAAQASSLDPTLMN